FGIDDVTIREMNTETDILTYSFAEQTGPATIDDVNYTVDVEVAYGTDLTGLVADFTLSDGATAEVGGVLQESGVTANDFTSPVTYTVIAEDGTTTQDWVVTVTEQMPDLALIEPASSFACDLTNTESIYIEINNVGNATIPFGDSIQFVLDSEGTILIDEYIYLTSDMAPGDTYSGFTDTDIDLSAVGTYLYSASITHLDDANPDNDTIHGYLVHFSQEIEFVGAVNDTILINSADYPYDILTNVVYTPDSTLMPTYLWGDGSTASTLTVGADGWYTLEVTTQVCTVEDSVYVASFNKIDSDNIADFAIYPNPTEGDIMLEMTLAEKQDVVVTITNSSGQIVANYKFDDVEKLREPIDLNGVAQGLYNLRVNAGNNSYTRQIVVK
ncbi:MAG: T9SS type A sorting domain-containing protein, partial [Bacteroidales bacterium]